MRTERHTVRLHIEGAWREVPEPTTGELQAFHLWPKELNKRRLLEIGCFLYQVRLRTSAADRQFLKGLRIEAPADFWGEPA